MNIETETRKALARAVEGCEMVPSGGTAIASRILRRVAFYVAGALITASMLTAAAIQLPRIVQGGEDGTLRPAAEPTGSQHPSDRVEQEDTLVETCSSRDFTAGMPSHAGDVPSDWRSDSTMVGPLGLYQIGVALDQPSTSFRPIEGVEYPGLIFYPIVEMGRTVTLEVDRSSVSFMSLYVNFTGSPGIELQEGVERLVLEACSDRDTDFSVAFVVTEERCATLNVYLDPSSDPREVRLPFGKSTCPASD